MLISRTDQDQPQRFPPLFDIKGAEWGNDNQQVWVDRLQTARMVDRTLKAHGYTQVSSTELDRGIYKFRYLDKDSGSKGRSDTVSEYVDMIVRSLNFGTLMLEVAYRFGEHQWQIFQEEPWKPGCWSSVFDAELPELLCKRRYPKAEVLIRPTLYPQNP